MDEQIVNEEYIKCFNNGERIWDICNKFNDTYKNVFEKIYNHRFEARLLPDEEKQRIVNMYKSGIQTVKIGKEYGVTNKPIANILESFNIQRSQKDMVRKYKLNQKFFDIIDTQEKAYCFGLFTADGQNNPKKSTVVISLEECDVDLLEQVRKAIGSEKPLEYIDYSNKHDFGYDYENQYRLLMFSRHMCDSLIQHGLIPNKSLKIQFPDFIPDNLMSHYIRGVFDGDGSIGYKNLESYFRHEHNTLNVSIVSTHSYCESLQSYLSNIGIKSTVSKPLKKNNITATLNISGKESQRIFLDWMYRDANIYLNRKHDIYLQHYGINK